MDKMRMETLNLTARNVEKIAALFPNCVTEALDEERSTKERKVYKKVVNFELLRQMLSDEVIEGDEAYEFTWVGKKAAIVEAHKPIRKTLRPCPEESVNWDTTENLYIEGDNLEVLKLLQESYLGKVKMIYIDPPYNTGHDFVYPDSFIMDNEEYNAGTGYFDDDGNVNFSRENSTAAGKYHSDWCSMMYSRLLLARDLLTDDGVIFISIDDNEVSNLKKICDEIFGAENFIANIVWEKMYTTKNDSGKVSNSHEYILIYVRDDSVASIKLLPRTDEMDARYKNPDNDSRGPWKPIPLYGKGERKNGRYAVVNPHNGNEYWPAPNSHWLYRKEDTEKLIAENRIYFGKDGTAQPNIKRFLSEVQQGTKIKSLWKFSEVGSNDSAKRELKILYEDESIPFSFPKPVTLIKQMLLVGTNTDSIVLDFFSGSSTTAHAVMQLNAEEMSAGGGHSCRKFIMVQLPEPIAKKSEAFKAGYKNICEIGKERIRRAGKKILEENADKEGIDKLDVGFRVLKLDDSNMNDVYYAAGDYTQDLLRNMESNIKDDRTDLDLLFGCLLEWGLPLSLPYTSETIEGATVHTYNDGDLVACFDENISDAAIKAIAKKKPLRAVFRDSSFADSPAKINVGEIFKILSPDTRVKVI